MSELIKRFNITDPFWKRYGDLLSEVVIPYQEAVLRDEVPGAEKSHAIENFRLAAEVVKNGKEPGGFYGLVFQDSDVAKWIEAASYSLIRHPDSGLEERIDRVIETIRDSQHEDGYVNTYFTLKEPGRQWTNLQEAHELYCAGHMIEAAVAYYEATGKTVLLETMKRMADHIYDLFIVRKKAGYSGHPEIELALMRLYRATGDRRYMELSKHLTDVRGQDPDYFVKENAEKGWKIWGMDPELREYAQNQCPVREMTKATGHAVRATYLYTAMADLAKASDDEELKEASERLFKNISEKQMYITGGIGATSNGEAFTTDYDLPNGTVYAETCASIGLIFFARKMLDLKADGRYADVMERALYNTVLAGMQLDGKRFFYVNPLEVIPGISGIVPDRRHVLPERPGWYDCACCPPNVARMIGSLAEYAWSIKDGTVFSHLFVGGELDLSDSLGSKIKVETRYPYGETVRYTVEGNPVSLALRIPSWSSICLLTVDGKITHVSAKDGYQYIKCAKEAIMYLNMSPRYCYANSMVASDSGKAAVMRGPLVYCAEGMDNDGDVIGLRFKDEGRLESLPPSDDLMGTVKVEAEGFRVKTSDELYSSDSPKYRSAVITLIPYYAWGNRGKTQMRVWLPVK